MSDKRIKHLELINDICEQFELLLQQGKAVGIADWIQLVDEERRPELFTELLRLETHYDSDSSSNQIGDYFRRFPEHSNEIVKVFINNRQSSDELKIADSDADGRQISVGDLIGRFQIISPLGVGGFSAVFLAHDPIHKRAVALKVLRPDAGFDTPRNMECIVNEANVLSKIDHPATPKIYDVGEDEDGKPWVSMEFIKGESLFDLLSKDQLSLVEALRILVATANSVHEIHETGFTHRDIKPDNIIVGLDGEPRILDYGLALHEDIQRDKSGERAGTTAFMSPEQVRGQSEDLDGRTDVWSLGVILYLMIANRLPFSGETKDDIRRDILKQPVKPPRQVKNNVATIELEEVCFRALKKNPEQRFPTAKDFANAVQDAIEVLPAEFILQDASRTRTLTRAENSALQLARQARLWEAQPNASNLPGPIRYCQYLVRTNRLQWSDAESKMMASATRRLRRFGALIAILVFAFWLAYYDIQSRILNGKVQQVVSVISQTPVADVREAFGELSAFAPAKCLAEIRNAYENADVLNPDDKTNKLRYAIILGPSPEFQPLFREVLLDSRAEEIEIFSEMAWANENEGDLPELSEQMKQKLVGIVADSQWVSGLESIWEPAPDKFVDLFEDLGGELTPRFAWCQKIRLEKFKDLAKQLRPFRYRPVCVRPWVASKDNQYVAAIWHRSADDWRIAYDLTPAQFMSQTQTETRMHLVDVSDGLQKPGDDPKLIAVWSSQDNAYGKPRHMVLAQRLPQLKDPQWQREVDPDNCVIGRDIDTVYLKRAPLLIDVQIHNGDRYQPDEAREHQKLKVGQMILGTCRGNPDEIVRGNPDFERFRSGSRLSADAYYCLGEFAQSSDHVEKEVGPDTSWAELHFRTLAFAKSGDEVMANHFKALTQKKLASLVRKALLWHGKGQAIDCALGAEIDYWNDRDAEAFLSRVNKRLKKVQNSTSLRKYRPKEEFYWMALSASSVAHAEARSQSEGSNGTEAKLNELANRLVDLALALDPKLEDEFVKWRELQATQGSSEISKKLHNGSAPLQSSAWSKLAARFDSKFIQPRADQVHAYACKNIEDGYFPVSFVFAKSISGNPKKGSVWHSVRESAGISPEEQQLANAFCVALRQKADLGIWRILKSPEQSALKQRIIDTIYRFRIDVQVLLDRLENSTDVHLRYSVLCALRNYSRNNLSSKQVAAVLECLDRVEQSGTDQEKELVGIIRNNIDPVPVENTTP